MVHMLAAAVFVVALMGGALSIWTMIVSRLDRIITVLDREPREDALASLPVARPARMRVIAIRREAPHRPAPLRAAA